MAKKADSFSEHKNIIDNLKKGDYKPVYFLCGSESYYIDKISDFAEDHILSEGEKGFNQTIVYGKDVTGSQLVGICKRYPMMGNHQVVIVKEAQHVKELDYLGHYIDSPLSSTILIMCWKSEKYDKRLKFFKSLQKYIFFESMPIYENMMPQWIEKYAAGKGMKITPKASQLMAEHIGTDLTIVANEIEKISINKKEGETINETDVETHTGISKEYNIFELQKYLARRDFHRSYNILQHFAAEGGRNSIVPVIASLYGFFAKIYIMHFETNKSANAIKEVLGLNYYAAEDLVAGIRNYPGSKVIQVMKILLEYDLKSKGINDMGTSDGELYKEMLFKILN